MNDITDNPKLLFLRMKLFGAEITKAGIGDTITVPPTRSQPAASSWSQEQKRKFRKLKRQSILPEMFDFGGHRLKRTERSRVTALLCAREITKMSPRMAAKIYSDYTFEINTAHRILGGLWAVSSNPVLRIDLNMLSKYCAQIKTQHWSDTFVAIVMRRLWWKHVHREASKKTQEQHAGLQAYGFRSHHHRSSRRWHKLFKLNRMIARTTEILMDTTSPACVRMGISSAKEPLCDWQSTSSLTKQKKQIQHQKGCKT